jgi:hypothetical protein
MSFAAVLGHPQDLRVGSRGRWGLFLGFRIGRTLTRSEAIIRPYSALRDS